jgi:DNA ligase-1
MQNLASTAAAISKTSSRLKKIALLADYLRGLPDEDLRAAAVFFTGRPFPLTDARILNVGWAALLRSVQEITEANDELVQNTYLETGDLGETAGRLLPEGVQPQLSPARVRLVFDELAQTQGAAAKQALVTDLLRQLTPIEAQYLVKIITGDLRIGLKESTVEDALAKAFEQPAALVRRTNMSLGDIGETAVLARQGRLAETSLQLFRPLKFMLATPVETEEEIFAILSGSFYVEDKYDGIRGQLHRDESGVALYSRTLDDVSPQFPEVAEEARGLQATLIADGEIVAYRDGQVLPFAMLQKRLGRKRPSAALLAEIPTAFMAFDILSLNGQTLIDEPLAQRKKALESVPWSGTSGRLVPAPFLAVEHRIPLDPLFEQATQRRNEGLMLKDAASFYIPGKRGMSWLKWKKALATLDVVVTGVEFGHGRRRDVLSDYTFAVQKNGELVNIGKAYSGLTDAEILEMTAFFKEHTMQDFGRFRLVEPRIVIEVAFNGIQRSSRHKSGFALRFPRIARIRHDKRLEEIDTIETVERLYDSSVHGKEDS